MRLGSTDFVNAVRARNEQCDWLRGRHLLIHTHTPPCVCLWVVATRYSMSFLFIERDQLWNANKLKSSGKKPSRCLENKLQ